MIASSDTKTENDIPHSKPWICKEDRAAVDQLISAGRISTGEKVAEFESTLSDFVGNQVALATDSGTSALVYALRAIGVGSRDEVIMPTYTCRQVLSAVTTTGANAVFVDADAYGVINLDSVKNALTQKTRAVIAVHAFGNQVDIESINKLGVPIVEDACPNFGSRYWRKPGHRVGSNSIVSVFSFHATKVITGGGGGAVCTSDKRVAESLRSQKKSFDWKAMSDIQATLCLSQLSRFDQFESRRTELFIRYSKRAQELGLTINIQEKLPFPFRFCINAGSGFLGKRELFSQHGIQIRQGVDTLNHRFFGLSDTQFPNSVELLRANVSLPFYPALTDTDIDRVLDKMSLLVS